MVRKIVGYSDEDCQVKVFERDAREYDRTISNGLFGISMSDIVKTIPIFIACIIFYADQMAFKKAQLEFNQQMVSSVNSISNSLGNLNNYLSSTTGKQFKDGRPF